MTLLAYLLAISDQTAVTLRIAAGVATFAAVASVVCSIETTIDDRAKLAGRMAQRFALAAVLALIASVLVPGRDDLKLGAALARDLTCQPGGCK